MQCSGAPLRAAAPWSPPYLTQGPSPLQNLVSLAKRQNQPQLKASPVSYGNALWVDIAHQGALGLDNSPGWALEARAAEPLGDQGGPD